jgi:uncharacterized lipoprotein NlpE involved in copper resistance
MSLLVAALIIFGLSSCLSNKEQNKICNAKNSLNWEGVYTGTITMLGNGNAASVRIRLYRDQSLEFNHVYVDGSYEPIIYRAPFIWDDTGNIIMLDAMDAPVQYKVERDKLIRLDDNNYVLKKVH